MQITKKQVAHLLFKRVEMTDLAKEIIVTQVKTTGMTTGLLDRPLIDLEKAQIEIEVSYLSERSKKPVENKKVYKFEDFVANAAKIELESTITYKNEADLAEIVQMHEKALSTSFAGGIYNKIKYLLDHYQHKQDIFNFANRKFISDIITQMKALSIVAQMVSNAQTHAEKNARMRGLMEIIDGAINEMQNIDFKEILSSYEYESVFKPTYPVQRLLGKLRDARAELATLKMKYEPETAKDDPQVNRDLPF